MAVPGDMPSCRLRMLSSAEGCMGRCMAAVQHACLQIAGYQKVALW